jgi:hypothetical protein
VGHPKVADTAFLLPGKEEAADRVNGNTSESTDSIDVISITSRSRSDIGLATAKRGRS